MEHTIVAPADGRRRGGPLRAGDRVAEGADLVDLDDGVTSTPRATLLLQMPGARRRRVAQLRSRRRCPRRQIARVARRVRPIPTYARRLATARRRSSTRVAADARRSSTSAPASTRCSRCRRCRATCRSSGSRTRAWPSRWPSTRRSRCCAPTAKLDVYARAAARRPAGSTRAAPAEDGIRRRRARHRRARRGRSRRRSRRSAFRVRGWSAQRARRCRGVAAYAGARELAAFLRGLARPRLPAAADAGTRAGCSTAPRSSQLAARRARRQHRRAARSSSTPT